MEQSHSIEEQAKVWDMISGAQAAVLLTKDLDGRLDARPMACVQHDFDGALWFLTRKASHKLEEIAQNPDVLVSHANPKTMEFVAVAGRARIVDNADIAKSLWNEAHRVWFPGGPDDPDLALISIDVESAKYWNGPSSALSYGVAYLAALFAGWRASSHKIMDEKQVVFKRS